MQHVAACNACKTGSKWFLPHFLLIAVLSIILQSLSCKTSPKELQDLAVASSDLTSETDTSNYSLVFFSDTQSPMKIETIWLEYSNNDAATEKIYSTILLEKNVAAIFHLGDITAAGSNISKWEHTKKELEEIRRVRLPFYAIPGNHEYMFSPKKGITNFSKTFPELKGTWYGVRIGAVAVLMLNSNFSKLSGKEILQQRLWYEDELYKLDNDPSARMIIAATHHPPYTNSKLVGASEDVQKMFLPMFQKCRKCLLFVSGHSHAFEHFHKQGKDFLVIGGGGGLLHTLKTGSEQAWHDLFPEKTERRFFHYITCEMKDNGLTVSVNRLKPDHSGFDIPYRFTILTADVTIQAIKLAR